MIFNINILNIIKHWNFSGKQWHNLYFYLSSDGSSITVSLYWISINPSATASFLSSSRMNVCFVIYGLEEQCHKSIIVLFKLLLRRTVIYSIKTLFYNYEQLFVYRFIWQYCHNLKFDVIKLILYLSYY